CRIGHSGHGEILRIIAIGGMLLYCGLASGRARETDNFTSFERTVPPGGKRTMPPTLANGKICYIENTPDEVRRSADFYAKVFGWRLRQRGDGHTAFDDATGEVSGTWVVGRPPSPTPGLLIYIMVDSVKATIDAVVAHGGELVQPIGGDAPEITARFR